MAEKTYLAFLNADPWAGQHDPVSLISVCLLLLIIVADILHLNILSISLLSDKCWQKKIYSTSPSSAIAWPCTAVSPVILCKIMKDVKST